MEVKDEIIEAESRIRQHILETPLIYSSILSSQVKGKVYLKLEAEQVTGSFKIRGATNKLLSLNSSKRKKGVVTASTGNHGFAVAYASRKLGIKATIYLPKNAAKNKIKKLRDYKATLKLYGSDSVETEIFARNEAEKNNLTFISPYNDWQIIGGQGTIAVELEKQLDLIDAVLVPVGGGGLIAGIGAFLKTSRNSKIRVFGCLPHASPVMYKSVKSGKIVEMKSEETLSGATAGGIEPNSITFELCKKLVDDYFLLSEQEIKHAIKLIYQNHQKIIEGAAALTVAAVLKNKELFQDQNVVLVLSGGNISEEKLKEILKTD